MTDRSSQKLTHYEWNGRLYCERTHQGFPWKMENPLTPPEKCPHCETELMGQESPRKGKAIRVSVGKWRFTIALYRVTEAL